MKYKIVTDSSANLISVEDIAFSSVPLEIITKEKTYIDNSDLDVVEMVRDLREYKGTSSTACPSAYDWMNAFEDADIVFGVTITGTMSGCYNAAMIAKKDYEVENPGKHVHIIDSLSTGPEMELIVEKLRELMLAGKEYEEIKAEIQAYQKNTHLIFMLESLNNLAKNGRVSKAVAATAGVLGIRLIGKASNKGTLEPIGKCRGEKKVAAALFEHLQKMGYRGGKVRIAHCYNEEAAVCLKELILTKYQNADIKILICRGLCSYYAEDRGVFAGFEG